MLVYPNSKKGFSLRFIFIWSCVGDVAYGGQKQALDPLDLELEIVYTAQHEF